MGNQETKMMKKILVTVITLLIATSFFAQEYPLIKVAEFENKREEGYFFIRMPENVAPNDDATGSGLKFDEKGNCYMIQTDMSIMYQFDISKNSLVKLANLNFLELGAEGITTIRESKFFCSGMMGRFKLLDEKFNYIFKINMLDWNVRLDTRSAYYDEEINILLFTDSQYKLHSIVNPGMDEAQNKANYRNPEETIALFESGTDLQGLTRDEKGRIYKNGVYIGPNFTPVVGKYRYEWSSFSLGISDGKELLLKERIKLPRQRNEIYESTAVHPSGDIYLLRYNKETDKHILYKIENTWDLEAKKAWQNR